MNEYVAEQKEALRLKGNVDANIAHKNLKQAEKAKAELAEKLESIQESIKTLEHQKVQQQPPQRIAVMDSNTRAQFKAEEHKKKAEAEKFAKEMAEVRANILKEKKEQKRRIREKQRKQREALTKRQKNQEDQKEQEKVDHREKLKEMHRQRDEEKQRRQKLLHEGPSSSQAGFKKIEKKYYQKVLMPELENRKRQLNAKRELFQPLEHQKLIEHSNQYENIAREKEQLRKEKERLRSEKLHENLSHQPSKSNFYNKTVEQEEDERKELFRQSIERKELLNKQRTYSELVKQVHKPTIDSTKTLQIKSNIEKTQGHGTKSSMTLRASSSAVAIGPGSEQPEQSRVYTIRKFKPNPMAPKPQPARPSKAVDYLAQRRAAKEDIESELANKPTEKVDLEYEFYQADQLDAKETARILRKAAKVERDAKRKEVLISHADITRPTAIQTSDDTADALISSVRAKLKILES